MSNFSSFSRGHRTIVASFGQDESHCAGVAVAAVHEFYTQRFREVGPANIDEFARRLTQNAATYYQITINNAMNDGEHDENGFVELRYCFHSIREADKLNIININPNALLSFETPVSRTVNSNGTGSDLTDYVEGWIDSDFKSMVASYLKSRDNLILFTQSRQHYVTIFKVVNQFLVVDGLGRYRFVFYRDFSTLLKDLCEFRDNSVFAFYHLRHEIFVKDPVDPKTVSVIDNCDDVRLMIENIIHEKAMEKNVKYQKSTSIIDCCRVDGCDNMKYGQSIHESVCGFHVSVAKKFWTVTNGLRCSTPKCTRKPAYGDKCCACRKDSEFQEKALADRNRDIETRWSNDYIINISRMVADSLIQFVHSNPHIQLYIGITVQPFKKRLTQHIERGYLFNEAVILLEVPNAHSLAEIEYQTILMVSEG